MYDVRCTTYDGRCTMYDVDIQCTETLRAQGVVQYHGLTLFRPSQYNLWLTHSTETTCNDVQRTMYDVRSAMYDGRRTTYDARCTTGDVRRTICPETRRVQGAVQCHGLALSQPGQCSLRLTISTQTHRVQGTVKR